jgi:hypothetical protein
VGILLLAVGMAGCVTEHIDIDSPQPAKNGKEVTFTVSVPGMKTPSIRALDASKEKEVSEIDVVIFRNQDNTLVEYHRIAFGDISNVAGNYLFKARGVESSENITFVVVANASLEVSAALTAVTANGSYVGAAKKDFLQALQVSNGTKWNTSMGNYWKIPMYGEAVVQGNIHSVSIPIVKLTRMLAKVDVVNAANGNFTLTAVHVVNYNTKGFVAPTWDETGDPATDVVTANLPANPATKNWEEGNELTYALSQGQSSLENEIYLFESNALSNNPTTPDGMRLVFEGTYTSGGVTKSYYYPADFTAPYNVSTGKTNYMPVLRNNRYLFTITAATGRGYDKLNDAVAAFGVMSNLKVTLIVVDETGIMHMVWNGEHFLGVSRKNITVTANGEQGKVLSISTNIADGWKAEIENPGTNNWLRFAGDATTASGSPKEKQLTLNINSNAGASRTANILLTAGRLSVTLTVTQEAGL